MTPLTQEQYSELVRALELTRTMCVLDDTRPVLVSLQAIYTRGMCSDWCFVYLTQWFDKVGATYSHIPLMVAELCEERC